MPIGLQAAGRIYPRKMWAAAGSVSITCEHRSLRCRHWVMNGRKATCALSPFDSQLRTLVRASRRSHSCHKLTFGRSEPLGPKEAVGRSNGARSPAESDPAASRVALAAVGKLAVEASEQRRILIERDSRTGIDLQGVAPGARAVHREQRARDRHE